MISVTIHVLRNFGPKPISRNALKIKVPQSTHRLAKSSQKEKKRLGTCQKLAGGEGGVGILNLGSEIR